MTRNSSRYLISNYLITIMIIVIDNYLKNKLVTLSGSHPGNLSSLVYICLLSRGIEWVRLNNLEMLWIFLCKLYLLRIMITIIIVMTIIIKKIVYNFYMQKKSVTITVRIGL